MNIIDPKLMIRITDAIYTNNMTRPSFNEMVDMFSSGQLLSKVWLIQALKGVFIPKSVLLVGGWYGLLGYYLIKSIPSISKVTTLDIDPCCEHFVHQCFYDTPSITAVTDDMYSYNYADNYHNVVINTSMEHIADHKEWLALIPKNTIVVLQSNNFVTHEQHINCASSIQHFVEQTGLNTILYQDTLTLPMYDRYMIIGQT